MLAFSGDIQVRDMMKVLQNQYPERRDRLLQVLCINPDWNMLRLSDGQRRRVQIFLALLRPLRFILLDEALAILDIISRKNLLNYLKEESINNGVTILLATHVFDAMDEWPTHLMFLNKTGRLRIFDSLTNIPEYTALLKHYKYQPLLLLIEKWIREEEKLNENEDEGNIQPDGDLSQAQISAGGYAPGRFCGYQLDMKNSDIKGV